MPPLEQPPSGAHLDYVRDLARLGSFELDLENGEIVCSIGTSRLLGWAADVSPNLTMLVEIVHPDDVEQFDSRIDDLRSLSGKPISAYIRIIRPGHEVRQLAIRAVVPPGSRAPPKAFGVMQDVTDFMADRQVLAESMLLAQTMFRSAPWGMFQTTKDGRYLNSNPALARIYGFESVAEMQAGLTNIGSQLYVEPGRRSEFIRLMKRDGQISNFESEIYRRDGQKIWISESCREVRTRSGRFVYYEGAVTEVTAQKNAEAALVAANETAQAQKRRFAAALENMSQGLCMFGPDGLLVVDNPRFREIYGFASDTSIEGMTLEEILCRSPSLGRDSLECRRLIAEQLEMAESRSRELLTQEFPDGRIITIAHEPMQGGGFVDTLTDVTEQRLAAARIAHMSLHDPLTDLPNRALFRERLVQSLHRIPRGEACAVLCLDLDQFKSVNDTLGHPVGDALLKAVTGRLLRLVRPTDTVARLGGDEFAIVQSSVNHPQDATTLSVRLLRELSLPYDIEGHHVVIGTSIGIALAPSDGMDPDHLLKSADLALYQAKSDGRGRYRYFEPEMDTEMQARRQLELDLRAALNAEEFELFYQPVVDVKENAIVGFEALLRWNSRVRGMVSPASFIPLAEEIGLINPIGEWVLLTACQEAMTWPGSLKVAVNVSAVQFKGKNLTEVVRNALQISGLPANRLELEVTESVLVDDVEGAIQLLHEIKKLGVRIAMDDFGTGYSSLSYISRFPFDKIKIDQSFVRDLGKKADCMAIIRAVTGLCDSLGVTATAEGLETEEQLTLLREEYCSEVQGYLISRPRPRGDLPKLLSDFAKSGLPGDIPLPIPDLLGRRRRVVAPALL